MRVLAVLQLFVWLFALQFVAIGVLCIVGIDLLVWLEAGAVAAAVHLPVLAALILRRASRLTSGTLAL